METSDRKVTGSWASKKTTPVVALVIDLLIVTWPELRASSPHIRPLVGEVWSNFKNRLRILENEIPRTERNTPSSLVTRRDTWLSLSSASRILRYTCRNHRFRDDFPRNRDKNGANDSQFSPSLKEGVRDVFWDRSDTRKTDWNDINMDFYVLYFRREFWRILKWSWLIYFYCDEVSWFGYVDPKDGVSKKKIYNGFINTVRLNWIFVFKNY